jgi:Nif-specific regulatory protein
MAEIHSIEPATPQSEAPVNDLLVIDEAAKLIGQSAETEHAINATLRLLSQMVGLNRGRVLLPDPATNSLHIRYAYGLTPEEKNRGVYGLGEGITGRVMKTGQTAIIQDIDDEPQYLRRAVERTTLPQETVAYIAVPLLKDDTPIGVLAAHRLRRRQRPFSDDLRILRVVATLITQMLQIQRLISERTAALVSENRSLKNALDSKGSAYGILGESTALSNALRHAHRVADTAASVLLTGESGTGKEKFARMLHLASSRKDGPFVALNCAAIPSDLLESELFGQEKGSFTGATQAKKGRIEMASGGTLFLDEIGDLDMELQSKLLRVLEEQTIQHVGGVRDIRVDVRVVAATHKNLQKAVNDGSFRIDLFYRLNVFPIHLPPLRERAGDVRILARHFLNAANHDYKRNVQFGPGVIERLDSYDWPGNIRQLENVVKRAVLMAGTEQMSFSEIEAILMQESNVSRNREVPRRMEPPPSYGNGMMRPDEPHTDTSVRPYAWVREDEAEAITTALQRCGGNKTRAALSLGLTPRQLRYRLEKLGL